MHKRDTAGVKGEGSRAATDEGAMSTKWPAQWPAARSRVKDAAGSRSVAGRGEDDDRGRADAKGARRDLQSHGRGSDAAGAERAVGHRR